MNRRITVLAGLALLGAGFSLGSLVSTSQADDHEMDMQAIMQKWADYGTPGPEHKKLLESVGTWNIATKRWDYPGAEVVVGTATSVVVPALDGRFVSERFTSSMDMGAGPMDFEGHCLTGYDNLQHKVVYAWADSMGTGIMTGAGTYDATGKVLTTICDNAPDAVEGKFVKMKGVTREISKDEHLFEMFAQNPDGSWWKNMEMTYTRAK